MDNNSKDHLIRKYASYLERASWSLVFFGLLTQVSSEFAFPSYNVVMGFWGAYCSFSKHGRATFGCISFTFLTVILDIAFCSVNQSISSTFKFALSMLIFCLFTKILLLYSAAHFFAAIGGAASMDMNLDGTGGGGMDMSRSHFDNLVSSGNVVDAQGGYYPPEVSASLSRSNLGGSMGAGGANSLLMANSMLSSQSASQMINQGQGQQQERSI